MNKKILVILTAALLLLSATACKKDPGKTEDTTDAFDTAETGSYIVVGTDADGNPVTSPVEDDTDASDINDSQFDPTEENPTFTDVTMKVTVISHVGTVRTSTRIEDGNSIGWPSEGKILDATGESDNWYRVTYTNPTTGEEQDCYIAKTVAADASVLDGFTAIEDGEEVEITVNTVNVRSYPSTYTTNSIRGNLKQGDKATRVAVSDKWSRILFEVTSETETDEEGNPVVEIKQYYVSNDCLKVIEPATDAQ
jgi:hypothetical protein